MRDIEMRGALGIGKSLRQNDRTAVLAAWRLAKGAPHPLERAGVRVEDDDAVIAVTVGYEQFVGRRMDPGVFGLERARTVQQPDIVLRVDGEARCISELELRRQLRPRRIDLEHRHAAGLRLRRLSRALGSEKPCRWQTSSDDARQHNNETESLALHGFLLCEVK